MLQTQAIAGSIKYIVALAMVVIVILLLFFATNIFMALGSVGIGTLILLKGDFLPPKWRFTTAMIFFALAYILYMGWIL